MPEPFQEIIAAHMADLMRRIQSGVQDFEDKTVLVYRQDELLKEGAKVGIPCVGVVYLGMRARGSETGSVSRSLLADIFFDVYVIGQPESKSSDGDLMLEALDLLDLVRRTLLIQAAPGKRRWRFVSELPADLQGRIAYVQRWTTEIPLNGDRPS